MKTDLKHIIDTIQRTVVENNMFDAGDRVLIGVSGGPDSVALLSLLDELAPQLSISLGIAHLNHDLRPEAEGEARFVKTLATKMGLPLHVEKANVQAYRRQYRLSLEEAAREVRYSFYNRVRSTADYQKIALGHHSEDNAEMVLMNLLRGAGPLGLAGIPPVRDTCIVRPLINLTKAHIEAYLQYRRLSYVSDASNRDTRFTRNRIRHELLPFLKTHFNENISAILHRAATITGDEHRWMDSTLEPVYEQMIPAGQTSPMSLAMNALAPLEKAPLRRIIRRAIACLKGNLRGVTFAHIEAIINIVKMGTENSRVDLPGLVSAFIRDKHLMLAAMDAPRQPLKTHPLPPPYRYLIGQENIPDKQPYILEIPAIGARVIFNRRDDIKPSAIRGSGHHTAFFDINQLSFPLIIRNWQPGDRFTPLGMRGSKKVKKLFREHKMPRAARQRCPVLLSAGALVWVIGCQRAEIGKVILQTRNVLEIKFVLPD